MKILALVAFLQACSTMTIGGNYFMKRSRIGGDAAVVDMRSMESLTEIQSKDELKKAWLRKDTKIIQGELPREGQVPPR